MKKIALIFSLLFCVFLEAQPPAKFYTRIGGGGIDIGYAVKQTLEGNYIIAGSTTSYGAGNSDIYLVKLDSMGSVLWSKTLGGFNNDVAKSIVQVQDSGYVIAGFTNSFGNGGYDALLIRTDKFGNQIWRRTFGGLDWDFGYDLIQTSDGNIVMCGSTTSFGKGKTDGFVNKYDLNGNILWQNLYGGVEDDEFKGIYTKNGNEIYVAGMTKSYGEINGDMYVFKLGTNGDSLMRIIYGGNLYDNANDLTVNTIGDIYVVGGTYSYSSGLKQDGLMVQFTSGGNFIRKNNIGNANTAKEIFKVITSNSKFGEIIIIYSEDQNIGTKKDFLTIAIDPGLYFIIGGKSGSFGFSDDEEPYDICPTKDKGYAQVGYTKNLNAIDKDVFFVKRDSMLEYGANVVNIKKNSLINNRSIMVYPNPIENEKEITIDFGFQNIKTSYEAIIYNISGELIKKDKIEESKLTIDINHLCKGMYILNIKNEKEDYYFKILKL